MRASNQLLLGIKKLTLLRNHKVSFSLPRISIRHLPLRRAIARKPQYGEVHILSRASYNTMFTVASYNTI